MKKSKPAIFFDCLFIAFTIFFILYVWLNRYIKIAFLSLFICISISFLIFIVIFLQNLKKYNKILVGKNESDFLKQCLHYFKYEQTKTINLFIEKLLNCSQISNNIFINNNYAFYINLKHEVSSVDFLTANDYALENNFKSKLAFICDKQSTSFKQCLSESPIKYLVFDFKDLFEIMKVKNLFPIKNNFKKITFSDVLKNKKTILIESLSKQNFKKYFLSGLSLLFLSTFIPYSFYYILCGTILLFFSIICVFSKNKIQTKKDTVSLSNIIKK